MENKLPRMRTLDECAVMLRELDPDTAVSKHYVRRLALTGEIPTVMCGRKRLINFDKLIEYLNGAAHRIGEDVQYADLRRNQKSRLRSEGV